MYFHNKETQMVQIKREHYQAWIRGGVSWRLKTPRKLHQFHPLNGESERWQIEGSEGFALMVTLYMLYDHGPQIRYGALPIVNSEIDITNARLTEDYHSFQSAFVEMRAIFSSVCNLQEPPVRIDPEVPGASGPVPRAGGPPTSTSSQSWWTPECSN